MEWLFSLFSLNFGVAIMPTLVFFSTSLHQPACHDVNRFVSLPFSYTLVIFPSSYRVIYCFHGAEVEDTATTFLRAPLILCCYNSGQIASNDRGGISIEDGRAVS